MLATVSTPWTSDQGPDVGSAESQTSPAPSPATQSVVEGQETESNSSAPVGVALQLGLALAGSVDTSASPLVWIATQSCSDAHDSPTMSRVPFPRVVPLDQDAVTPPVRTYASRLETTTHIPPGVQETPLAAVVKPLSVAGADQSVPPSALTITRPLESAATHSPPLAEQARAVRGWAASISCGGPKLAPISARAAPGRSARDDTTATAKVASRPARSRRRHAFMVDS
jgi:hypothetical protein